MIYLLKYKCPLYNIIRWITHQSHLYYLSWSWLVPLRKSRNRKIKSTRPSLTTLITLKFYLLRPKQNQPIMAISLHCKLNTLKKLTCLPESPSTGLTTAIMMVTQSMKFSSQKKQALKIISIHPMAKTSPMINVREISITNPVIIRARPCWRRDTSIA